MRYRLQWTEGSLQDLEALPEKVAWAVLNFCEYVLAENPRRVGKSLLAPFEGLHSARRGAYRIIYRIDDDVIVVEVIRIRHRSRAYRR